MSQTNRKTVSVTRFGHLMEIGRRTAMRLVKNRVVRKGRGLVIVKGRSRIDLDEFQRAYPAKPSRGRLLPLAEFCEETGVPLRAIKQAIKRGYWTVKDGLSRDGAYMDLD